MAKLTFEGRTQNIAAWARETGIKANTLLRRKQRGWSDERILSTGVLDHGSVEEALKYLPQEEVERARKLGTLRELVASRKPS